MDVAKFFLRYPQMQYILLIQQLLFQFNNISFQIYLGSI